MDLALLLALQTRLDQHLDQHRYADGTVDTSHTFHFPDLVITSQLIKASWPAGSAFAPSDAAAALLSKHIEPITAVLDSRPSKTTRACRRISDLWTAPDDAAQCGALLLTADAVLGDRDPASLRERVQPLIQAAYDRAPVRIYHAIRRADFSPDLARAMVRRVSTFYDGAEQARLLIPSRDCGFTIEEVPPLLPQNWFEIHLTGFTQHMINTNSWTTRHLRRAASLKLVEMTAGTQWVDSAETLGMLKGSAQRTMTVLKKQIPNDAMWQEFEAAVEQIAHTLDNDLERINYANRRRAMTNWEIPEADWKRLCTGIPRMGQMAARNRVIGTVLVWYTTVDSLSDVYLEDSWVLGIVEDTDANELRFRLEVVLTREHPAYHPPKLGEKYCYARGWLIFSDARTEWLRRSDSYAIDATGEKDYGNIDVLTRLDDRWCAEGSWGEVRIYTGTDPHLSLDAPEPRVSTDTWRS